MTTDVPHPVLVLSGWRAWPVLPRTLARALGARVEELRRGEKNPSPASKTRHPLPQGEREAEPEWRGSGAHSALDSTSPGFIPLAFPDCSTIDACVERVVTAAHERFGAGAVFDIVAVSMGGLVARAAILDGHGGRRLTARRVFTLATPHRGAKLAQWVRLDGASRDMQPGSPFLRELDARETQAGGRPYDLVCYARLGDRWVGSTNAAPPGIDPIWVPAIRGVPSHLMVSTDARIIDDIARRLLGMEPALTLGGPPPRD